MSREESREALDLILTGQPTPAQIGAFLIAHRIRRPEPQELAGMLDVYLEEGPKLHSQDHKRRPICFGMPFDGRKRIAPIYPLTSLILLSNGQPVVLQGGKRMPPKYGVTPQELFEVIGLNLNGLSIKQVEAGFHKYNLALIHQPNHFPLAEGLITYRDDIGKRPPIATMELMWTAHQGPHILICGFVHTLTENKLWETLKLMGEDNLITIKGLEGSIDLPINRPSITGHFQGGKFKRLILNPEDYNYFGKEIKWKGIQPWKEEALMALEGKGPLRDILCWNAGIYLWFSGIAKNLNEGISQAESCLTSGSAKKTLKTLIKWRATIQSEEAF